MLLTNPDLLYNLKWEEKPASPLETWDLDTIKKIHGYESLSKATKLLIIQGIIEQRDTLLAGLIPFMNIHEKRCREQGLDPMVCGIFPINPTDEDKKLLDEIKKILGEKDYDQIKASLEKKYHVQEEKELEKALQALLGFEESE